MAVCADPAGPGRAGRSWRCVLVWVGAEGGAFVGLESWAGGAEDLVGAAGAVALYNTSLPSALPKASEAINQIDMDESGDEWDYQKEGNGVVHRVLCALGLDARRLFTSEKNTSSLEQWGQEGMGETKFWVMIEVQRRRDVCICSRSWSGITGDW